MLTGGSGPDGMASLKMREGRNGIRSDGQSEDGFGGCRLRIS